MNSSFTGSGEKFVLWLLLFAMACCTQQSDDSEPISESTVIAQEEKLDEFEHTLSKIETRRVELAQRYQNAKGVDQRRNIREEARMYVVSTIMDEIFPAWMGTPWGLGKNSTSTRPHQPDMTVGCSYFVTSVLLNVGLKLDNRYTFAQAPAIHIQRSLAPQKTSLHRFLSISAQKLHDEIKKLGDGLYIVGLNNHIAFVVVRGDDVRMVHASYTPPKTVVDEPLLTSVAIDNSRGKGYFVTPLFQDDRLIELWLNGEPVPFQKLGYP